MSEWQDWHMDTDMWADDSADIDKKEGKTAGKKNHRRRCAVCELTEEYLYRRAWSESQILDLIGMEGLKSGVSYHVITGGDIDQTAWIRIMLRFVPQIDNLFISSWVVAGEEVTWFDEMMKSGRIHSLTILTGDIFPRQYRIEYQMCCTMIEKYEGRMHVYSSRSHAKIIAGCGGGRYFTIESSANCNTNRRIEQAVVASSRELYEFYVGYFDTLVKDEDIDRSE